MHVPIFSQFPPKRCVSLELVSRVEDLKPPKFQKANSFPSFSPHDTVLSFLCIRMHSGGRLNFEKKFRDIVPTRLLTSSTAKHPECLDHALRPPCKYRLPTGLSVIFDILLLVPAVDNKVNLCYLTAS